ncbi:MAG TPA: carboxypeptidase regulatory-like domain-containing protein [Pyrinomonadaceae bacterium]|jgi:hypothetical protein
MKAKKIVSSGIRLIAAVVISSFLFTVQSAGQSDLSSVKGIITDARNRVVSGAIVRLLNNEKKFARTSVTNDSGVYNFASIPPGIYRLEIEADGFKKKFQEKVIASIGTPTEINVELEVGSITETVEINGNEILINTLDGSKGFSMQSAIPQLPTDSRNVSTLLSLQGGVAPGGEVFGSRSDQGNFTMDGIDVNDQESGVDLVGDNGAFNTVLRISAEAVEEFRVTTFNPNANQGRSSGAQISLLTKGGTNSVHGVVFEFFRPTKGSANTFINNRAGVARENITRHVFGGTFGAPIVKDKMFVFYSFEGIRQPKTQRSVVQTVPLANLGQGIINLRRTNGEVLTLSRAQLNTIYAQAGLNPLALAVFADAARRYPANDFSSGAGDNLNTAGYRFNALTKKAYNTHILRLDYRIGKNQDIFFRGNKQHDVVTNPSAFPDTPAPQTWQHNTGLVFGHNQIIGKNKVNSFRAGLTRQSFTVGGDAKQNAVAFSLVFSPLNYTYSLSRVTPVINLTDDLTWTVGNYTLVFGGNVRIIRNKRQDLGQSFDNGFVNASFYEGSGTSLLAPIGDAGFSGINTSDVFNQAIVAAVIGRLSQYTARYNYGLDGNILPTGTPIRRTFAAEEYDVYAQDSWKIKPNLTLNLGLRYALSRPVYETEGFQIRPSLPLGEFFKRRLAGMQSGQPYNETLQFQLAGPKNNAPGYYSLDKNNFQPRISAAWSPGFKSGFWSKVFGAKHESVLRGGFAVTNDYFGQQLAVTFDKLSTLGFTTSSSIGADAYNATGNPAPLFTGFGQQINNLPGVPPLINRFQTPADGTPRIESSLDSSLVSPIHYNWSVSYGRKLRKGLYIEASYVGRAARNLLAERDVAAFNNLRDPRSGMDWYTAAGKIYDWYYSGANDVSSVAPIPYFENLFPNLQASIPTYAHAFEIPPETIPTINNSTQAVYFLAHRIAAGDWTFLQRLINNDYSPQQRWSNLFIHPQYAAFSAYSTVGKSDYHGANLSIHQRLGSRLIFDLNYTFSKSMDDASGIQASGGYGAAFILNPILRQDSYAVSDFDVRHVVTASGIWQIPFKKKHKLFGNWERGADALFGGWQLGGIFRWNTGLPFSAPLDLGGWATNWQLRSRFVRTKPISTSYFRGGDGQNANIFKNIEELTAALRPPRPGETGDRNVFRSSGFSVVDLNLGKTFTWHERHRLQFRYEVFNVFNYQYLSGISIIGITPARPVTVENPDGSAPSINAGAGEFTSIRGNARRMQFGLRYSF